MRTDLIPNSWREKLGAEFEKPYFKDLQSFVEEERATQKVFPPEEDVFSALSLTPFEEVKVLVLGQDPYHGDGQAHGLSFSVRPGVRIPPSLRNIYKELASDLDFTPPKHGYLTGWARQGILMINAVFTVRAHNANSHKGKGWEKFTDAIIKAANDRPEPIIFLLWGGYAKKKSRLIKNPQHTIITSAHPSPLSARRGFFGSKPFTKINTMLEARGAETIDWKDLSKEY